MIDLQPHAAGVVLPVQARPKARQNAITGEHAGRLKVSVTQAPENGEATEALIKLLGKLLDLKRTQIQLLSGATSGQKRFLIAGITVAELSARLTAQFPSDAQ